MGVFSRRESEPQPAPDENYEGLFPRIGGLGDDLRRLTETAEAAGELLRKVMGPGLQIEITVKVKECCQLSVVSIWFLVLKFMLCILTLHFGGIPMLTLSQLLSDVKARTPRHQRWMVERAVRCTLIEFPEYIADPARETDSDFAMSWLIERVQSRYRERYGNPLLIWLVWTIAAAAISVIVQKVIEWWIDHHHTTELMQVCEQVANEETVYRG